jgi:hypothetical protein
MPTWQAQLLRLTTFVDSPASKDTVEVWWEQVVGEEPDNSKAQPKLLQYIFDVQYGLGQLRLQVHPTRIDWLYGANDASEFEAQLGTFAAALGTLRDITSRWFALETCPQSLRVAFGAVLNVPVDSKAQAYQVLDSLLPNVTLDPYASDFLYQINRPREVRVDDSLILVNRLSKWTSLTAVQQQLVLGGSEILDLAFASQQVSVHLELDINTARNSNASFHPGMQKRVFEELTTMGQEIADKGDTP